MHPAPHQKELFVRPTPSPGTVFVNDRVSVQTEEKQRVVFVQGVVFSHYSIDDRSAEAYAMVQLFEAGYADQNDIARCFGYSARALRRYQERLKAGGLSALVRPEGRPSGTASGHKKIDARDRTILRLKAKGMSNRWIAGRLGLSETGVRKCLRRLGWNADLEPALLGQKLQKRRKRRREVHSGDMEVSSPLSYFSFCETGGVDLFEAAFFRESESD